MEEQGNLLDELLDDPGADTVGQYHALHRGAPETERRAAIEVQPRTGTARRRVLDLIASRGETGATDEEVSIALRMRLYTAAPRRTELVRGGWVMDSGKRRRTTTGSRAAVWMLTDAGRAQYGRLS
jgi:hypothetical protein